MANWRLKILEKIRENIRIESNEMLRLTDMKLLLLKQQSEAL